MPCYVLHLMREDCEMRETSSVLVLVGAECHDYCERIP